MVGVLCELQALAMTSWVHFNEATGLPIALDMIDELVLVPREIKRDFAEDVIL